jgi:serine/threonine-protein kinase
MSKGSTSVLGPRAALVFGAAIVLTVTTPCRADGVADAVAAEQLFNDARRLMDGKDFDAACPKLEASQHLDPGAGTLLNLARCYEGLGRTASAWATYRDAEGAAERSGRPDWSRIAREHAGALLPTLPRLSVVVPPEVVVSGLVLEKGDRPIDRALWGSPVPTDPGSYVISARAPGHIPWSLRVDVGSKNANVVVTVPPLPVDALAPPGPLADARAPASAPREQAPSSTQRTSGLIVGGVGLGAIAAGAIFGLIANGTYTSAIDDDCGGHANTCSRRGVDRIGTAHTEATVSTVLVAVGAVAAVTGAVVFLAAPSRQEHRPGVSVQVTTSPGSSSFDLRGWF